MTTSSLLGRAGAVPAMGVDAGTALHYGDPLGEQRRLVDGAGLVDRSNRGVITVSGADRLSWLHSICSQHVADLADGDRAHALVLSPNGHVEQDWQLSELGGQVWIDVEPGQVEPTLAYLQKMIFMRRVEPTDVSDDWAVLTVDGPLAASVVDGAGEPVPDERDLVARPDGGFVRRQPDGSYDLVLPRGQFEAVSTGLVVAGAAPVGAWAAAALRVERLQPRLNLETDHRTIPHEIGLIGEAVHLQKGCYRGQETVARVQNLGKPPRRLVRLHLSGESDELPEPGTPVELDGRSIGFLGTAVHHYELGPIALAVIKRTTSDDAQLIVGTSSAAIDTTDMKTPATVPASH